MLLSGLSKFRGVWLGEGLLSCWRSLIIWRLVVLGGVHELVSVLREAFQNRFEGGGTPQLETDEQSYIS